MDNKLEITEHCASWYQTLTGRCALYNTKKLCAKTTSEIFGYYAIQIGMLSKECDFLNDSRINASYSFAAPENLKGLNADSKVDHAVISSNEHLPISTDNIDLLIASHVLETSNNPHQVLREIDRVLVPEGHCILIGFNPFALSHINRSLLPFAKNKKESYQMRSVPRVKDWFSLLGFEVLDVNYAGFRPAVNNQKLFKSLQWMERWGEYAGPMLGSMYVIHAKKQVIAMRPNKKVWRAPTLLDGGKVVLNRTAQKVRRENFQASNKP